MTGSPPGQDSLERTVPGAYRFGRFSLLPAERVLRVDGEPVRIGSRAFDLLLALVERHGSTVTRRELFDIVWPGRVVEDQNLQVQVVALRKLLGAAAIATIPGRGYRFVGPVESDGAALDRAPSVVGPATVRADIIGRESELASVCSLLRDHRLVTVTGAGGIGKTRLAQAAADALQSTFRDGVCVVELAPVGDGALIAGTVARSLGFSPGGELATPAGVARALSGMTALLLLDNCEHLIGPVGSFVELVMRAAADLRVLATSQEPLRVPGEQLFRVGTLAVPPASPAAQALRYGSVALFVARARAVAPAFELDDTNTGVVSEICRRLDGIPLAIELAAARVPLLGVEGVRARLDERFRLLTGGARTAPTRHQTLRNALEWSHSLLSDEERAVFRRLAVFSGTFSLAAAQQVASDESLDEWSVLDQLGALVDKSLVVADSGAAPRYALLETNRAFALEQLVAAGEAAEWRRRHARAILATFQAAEERYLVEPTLEWMAGCLPDLDNWRDGLAFSTSPQGEPAVAILLTAAAAPFLAVAGLGGEGVAACDAAESAATRVLTPELRAMLALGRAQLGSTLALPPPQALAAAKDAAGYFRTAGDARHAYRALGCVALCGEWTGAGDEADAAVAEMAGLEEPDWPPALTSLRRQAQARALRRHGDIIAHRDASLEEAGRCAAAGELRTAWAMFQNAALAEISLGNVGRAQAIMRDVVEAIGARGVKREFCFQLAMYALACIEAGDPDAAQPAVDEAVALLSMQGTLWWLGDHLAWMPALRGDWPSAAVLHEWADVEATRHGATRGSVMQGARDRLAAELARHLDASALAAFRRRAEGLTDEDVRRLVASPGARDEHGIIGA